MTEGGAGDGPFNVIVLGMPRSGTSMAAGVFAKRGHHLGSIRLTYLRHGDDHNPFGYFEADDVVERNAALLRRVDHPYFNTWTFAPLPDSVVTDIWQLHHVDEDRQLVAAYRHHSPWVWKDQRLCFTLPYWWRLLQDGSTRVLLMRRDPRDIYASFQRMGWCGRSRRERARVYGLVRQHIGWAERGLERYDIPYLALDYAQFVADPVRTADELGSFFRVQIGPPDLNVRRELDHSRGLGRLAGLLRAQLRRLPRQRLRQLSGLIPDRLVEAIFPERRHSAHHKIPPDRIVSTEALAKNDVERPAEIEMARMLDERPFMIAMAARQTWGRSLSEELAERAGYDPTRLTEASAESLRLKLAEELRPRLDIIKKAGYGRRP